MAQDTSILITVGGDIAPLKSELQKADAALAGFSKKAEASAGKLGTLTAAAVAAGAAIGVAAFGIIKSQIDLADAFGDSAAKAGISAEEFSKLSYAFKFGTKEGTDLSQTLNFLNKAIASDASAFKDLGIAVRDSHGNIRDASSVLSDVSEKFSSMPDGANKAAFAMQLFGKSGADIIPFLNEGRDGIEGLKTQAEQLGIVLSTETAEAAGKFNDNLEILKARLSGVGMEMAGALLPSLVGTSEEMLRAGGTVDQLKAGLSALAEIAKVLAAVLAGRLAADALKSGSAFVTAQIEAYRYQKALAAMAGQSAIAGHAMGGMRSAASGLLGIMGGPAGLAFTVAAVGLSFIDFSSSAKIAQMSADQFNDRLATLTGNTDKLRESQQKLKMQGLMDEMRAISDEIASINRESELSNSKLGKGETERIQMLQSRLIELSKAYQEVSNAKLVAAAPVVDVDVGTSKSAEESPAVGKAREDAAKLAAIDAEKVRAAAENAALERETLLAAQATNLADLQKGLLTEQELMAADLETKRNQVLMANELGVGDKEANQLLIEQLEADHNAKLYDIDKRASDERKRTAEQEAAAKRAILGQSLSGLSSLMNSESRKMFETGKAAAIASAVVNTYLAATKALAELGPIAGPVAAGAMLLQGFNQVANIRKQQFGGGGGGAGGGGSNTTAVNAANTPVSSGGNAGPTTRTNVTLVGDTFGREAVIGLLNEAFKDGFTLST